MVYIYVILAVRREAVPFLFPPTSQVRSCRERALARRVAPMALRPSCSTASELLSGRWLPARSPPSAAERMPCCGEETRQANHPLCNRGQNSQAPLWKGHAGQLSMMTGRGCTCRNFSSDTFQWSPSTCALPAFDARRFCAALGPERLLFIGDSTMAQTAQVTINMVAWQFLRELPANLSLARRAVLSAASCHTNLHFAYSDTLIDNNFGSKNRGMSRNKAPTQRWSWSVRHLRPKYVVLSAGPHVSELANFSYILNEVAEKHRESFPDVELIWKTQNPAGCGATPIHDMWHTDGLFAVKQKETSFNWNLFPTFDKLARSFWSGRPHATVLDISATYLRVDAHVGSPYTRGKSRQGPNGCQRGAKRPCVRDCM